MSASAVVRRFMPYLLLPLALLATALANGLWLRAFPSSVMAAPLIGACVVSVLLPVAVAELFSRKLWITALVDLVALVLYLLFVVLRDPTGFPDLWSGLVHGPSQLLTFALPLVSPRSLLVAPVVLCWISGALAGECIGRGWQSVLPYAGWLVAFGLTYGGTARAITSASSARTQDTLLAAGLLLVLLLMRAAQSWIGQDETAEVTQANGILPLRGFGIGAVLALVLAAVTATIVQSPAFSGPPTSPQRVPAIDEGQPLTPLSFVNALRQRVLGGGTPQTLYRVRVANPANGYFAIASVDSYDGDGWTFQRTFRPSGGVIPADSDPALREGAREVAQSFTITGSALTTAPWMPYLERPARVTGTTIDVDAASGMIVPAARLQVGATYTVHSTTPATTFDDLDDTALAASSAPPSDRDVPGQLGSEMATIVASFADETGVPSSPAIPFLQAVSRDLQTRYSLSGSTPSSAPSSESSAPSSAPSSTTSSSAAPATRTGGTSFADVLTSILGTNRTATPEQYATLVALIARQVGVPARVVAGFRVTPEDGSTELAPGTYNVTDAQAWTWVEVPVRGAGWVVLDAAPSTYSGARPPQSVGAAPSHSPSPTSAPNALVTNDNNGNAVAPRSTVPGSSGLSAAAVLVLVLVGLSVVAVAIVAILLLRKRVRAHRRRRVHDPRNRLLGAWHESLDVLVESGLPEVESMTSAEVALATAKQFGDGPAEQATHLGEAANAAIFSPTTWITSAEADAAWTQHWRLRQEVRRTLTLRGRFVAGVRYHHVRPRRSLGGPASWSEALRAARQPKRKPRHAQRVQ